MIEEDQREIEDEKKLRELAHAYKRLFKTNDGKVVLKDLELLCGPNRVSVLNEMNPDPNQVLYAEGRRRVILRIYRFIRRKEDD